MTITQKRAKLWNEWMLASMANNEIYYYSTLWCGVPDGDDETTVMGDLKDGFYDDDIDETIAMYERVKSRYSKDGYYNYETGDVLTEDEAKEFLRGKRKWRTRIGK